MKYIEDYTNPYDAIEEFEKELALFAGAPLAVATDSCTHAIELGLLYKKPVMYAGIPAETHISVAMTMARLGIDTLYDDDPWENNYRIEGSLVWDSANHFEENMFECEIGKRKILCVSFGHGSPLEIGHGGAILTNDKKIHRWLKRAVYDGRNMGQIDQTEFEIGYHYMMRPEDAVIGLNKLATSEINTIPRKVYANLNNITINQ